jgi:hypothetical protein
LCNPVMKMKMVVILFCPFPSNGAPVERNWQGKTEVLGKTPVPVPLCPPQISHGLTRDRTRASAAGGRRLTAWAFLLRYVQFIIHHLHYHPVIQFYIVPETASLKYIANVNDSVGVKLSERLSLPFNLHLLPRSRMGGFMLTLTYMPLLYQNTNRRWLPTFRRNMLLLSSG